MSVNKFKDGELVKVSGSLASASSVSYTDETGRLDVTNVKDAIDKLTSKKVGKYKILNTLNEVIASTDDGGDVAIAGASAVKEVYNSLVNKTNNINTGLTNIFVVKEYNSPAVNIPAWSTATTNFSVALSGYTPIGILEMNNIADIEFYCYHAIVESNGVVNIGFQSTMYSSFSGAQVNIKVLYVKNGYGFY